MYPESLVHYPIRRRWPWQFRRCRCGLRLWRCPDFQHALYARTSHQEQGLARVPSRS
jgi:hypothetical protein